MWSNPEESKDSFTAAERQNSCTADSWACFHDWAEGGSEEPRQPPECEGEAIDDLSQLLHLSCVKTQQGY